MYSDIFIQQVRSCSDNMRSNYKHGITEYHLCSSKQPHCLHVCQRLLLVYKYSRDPGFAPSVLGLDFIVLGYLIYLEVMIPTCIVVIPLFMFLGRLSFLT